MDKYCEDFGALAKVSRFLQTIQASSGALIYRHGEDPGTYLDKVRLIALSLLFLPLRISFGHDYLASG
jgi:hypothetical protein